VSLHHGHLPGSPARNGLPERRDYTYRGTGEDVMPLPAEALEPYQVSYEQWLPQVRPRQQQATPERSPVPRLHLPARRGQLPRHLRRRAMSAADKREELEAAIRSARRDVGKCRNTGPCEFCETALSTALAVADEYAEAVADERIAGHVASVRRGRERLAEAVAEKYQAVTR